MSRKEYEFESDRWISFYYLGEFCIGRTLIADDIEMVATLTGSATMGIIPFVHIEDPHYLKFKSREPEEQTAENIKRQIEKELLVVTPTRKLLENIINIPIFFN